MALTLPYPGMVFVPLDTLSAEEMNQIVANYTYISNQFPVAGGNLDWSSLKGDFPVHGDGEIQLGFGFRCIVHRVCNVVFVNGTTVGSNLSSGTFPLDEIFPSWAVPVNGVTTSINGSVVDGASANIGWDIHHDGSMIMRVSPGMTSGSKRVNVSGAWVTDADWPE